MASVRLSGGVAVPDADAAKPQHGNDSESRDRARAKTVGHYLLGECCWGWSLMPPILAVHSVFHPCGSAMTRLFESCCLYSGCCVFSILPCAAFRVLTLCVGLLQAQPLERARLAR